MLEENRFGDILKVQFDVASYVPAWHPYEDFRELYACKADLGGGVLLTEIHEIDLTLWFFGLPKSVSCVGGNFSNFKLDVEDTCSLILEYDSFIITINLSFMQKYNKRDFYIAGENTYLECSFNNNYFKVIDYGNDSEKIFDDENQDMNKMFYDQANYFLNDLNESDSPYYLQVAENSLRTVEAAKESMETGMKVGLL